MLCISGCCRRSRQELPGMGWKEQESPSFCSSISEHQTDSQLICQFGPGVTSAVYIPSASAAFLYGDTIGQSICCLAKFFVFGRAEVEEVGESFLDVHGSILNMIQKSKAKFEEFFSLSRSFSHVLGGLSPQVKQTRGRCCMGISFSFQCPFPVCLCI